MKHYGRIANKDARTHVQNRQAFTASNSYAEYITHNANGDTLDTCRYVVYSYGKHFPMYIYEGGHWYANINEEKVSRTTAKHLTQFNPCLGQSVATPMNTAQMITIARWGIAGLAALGTGK